MSETYELELLEDGETIPMEDLGHVDDSGHEKIVEDQLQEEPHTACCVGEEDVVDILLNLTKGNIPDSEKLKEERRKEEENVDPRTLRTEMSDSDIEPISMHLGCVAGSSKNAQSQGIVSPKKLPSSKDANPEKAKSQNVDSSNKLSPTRGAKPEKIAQARNEKSTASKSLHKFPVKNCTNFTFASEKRRRLHWTAEDEEMLKEGVEKFSTKVNKNLPWKKVLEFGCHVFDPTRTPSDLKDKWRNIMAKESSVISSRHSSAPKTIKERKIMCSSSYFFRYSLNFFASGPKECKLLSCTWHMLGTNKEQSNFGGLNSIPKQRLEFT